MKAEKIKKPEYIAGISCFLCGLLVHLFGLVNVLHNSDDITLHPTGYGTGVASGRWLLTILGDFLDSQGLNYNLATVNGLVFIGFLAVSAGLLVMIFEIKDRQAAALLGAILVSFPTVCSTMLYKYTAGFYGLAFLFSILAVWVLPKYRFGGLLLSAGLTALALGIYQAYLPVTAAVFVLQLLRQTLDRNIPFRKLLLRGLYACLALILGLVLYFALTKLFLACYGKVLNDYQGINNMGRIDPAALPELIGNTYRRYFELAISDYCDLAPNGILKIAYWMLYGIHVILIISILLVKRMKAGNAVMALLLTAVFPVAVNLIEIMCPDSRIYTLMVYSCVVPLLVPVVLLELLPDKLPLKSLLSRVSAVVLLVIVLGNAYFTNVTYTSTFYVNRQTENYMASLVAQVRMTEGFDTEKKWAFVGTVDDPLIDNGWQDAPCYGGAETTDRLVSAYSWKEWIPVYLGYKIPLASNETMDAIRHTQQFLEMPCWPAEGSIQVIDDVIVIKFQEESES